MKMKSIPYGRQYISDEDISEMIKVLKSDYITQGPKNEEFEEHFAKIIGSKYAVALSNGTAALHISAMALGVKKGDNIIVPSLTFLASANCVRFCGGNVCFCDIDKDNYLIDIHALEQILKAQPKGYYKGIIPVDFAGYPIQADAFRKLADEYDLWIIEDACHAPGAYFIDNNKQKQLAGNGLFSDLTVFSFHPVKHITTGEGGMITTNNKELYNKLRMLRSHGTTKDTSLMRENHGGWYYEMQMLSYNYRLTNFQAALGISQLNRLEWNLRRRHEIAAKYNQAFAACSSIQTPKVTDNIFHAYHLYVIQVEDRLALYNHLKANNIFSQVHYIPVHWHPYYQDLGYKKGSLPITEDYYQHCLSLPMFPTLSNEEQDYVIDTILKFMK
ncbi:MAG: UDP-4-amino-4,6-dideoxy-N-acetyl-beta-L-altrosamine transaminase [Bacteroidales bacterium]|jgi:UDP-4-amino-4,6-dideoxy-N-acetyl-beta-L-altrosamine transaminase